MQISKKRNFSFQFSTVFLKYTSKFEKFQKKKYDPHSLFSSENTDREQRS